MILFADYSNKIVFIVPPKCGNHTISKWLNIELHTPIDNDLLLDDTFTKLIIYRDDIIDRFLSGFYEDLLNNSCYDNMDITFDDYLLFLYECFNNKIPNVDNLSNYLNKDAPVWFGNCHEKSSNITDANGCFCSHIQSQSYTINIFLDHIDSNVKIIELNDISKITNNNNKYNEKIKCRIDVDLSILKLCDIKMNNIIISKECLSDDHKSLILLMFNEDRIIINQLIDKFDYY
jgi:hypothetical protein